MRARAISSTGRQKMTDLVMQGEAERLATRLEAENTRPDGFRYALVDRSLLCATITFLRNVQGDYADEIGPPHCPSCDGDHL